MSWPDGELYLHPPQPLVVSLFLSLVSTLFSDWRLTVSLKFFDIQVALISTEELMLPRHARCVISRPRCNGYSLLLDYYLSRIGRVENPSCSACGHSSQDTSISFCTVQLRTLCATHSLAILSLFTTSGPDLGELFGLRGSMVFRHASIPRKGSSNQQQQQDKTCNGSRTSHHKPYQDQARRKLQSITNVVMNIDFRLVALSPTMQPTISAPKVLAYQPGMARCSCFV